MARAGLLIIATLLATSSLTQAQTPVERGSYLVNGLHVRARQIASNPLGPEPGLPGFGLTRLRPGPTSSACFSKYYPILSRCLQACGHQHDRRNHQRTDHGLSPVETAACTILPPPIPSQRCPGRFADTVYGVAGLPGLRGGSRAPKPLSGRHLWPRFGGAFSQVPPAGSQKAGRISCSRLQ